MPFSPEFWREEEMIESGTFVTDTTPMKPCPFCGAKIPPGTFTMTNNFKETICPGCGASARFEKWNKRVPQAHAGLDEALNTGAGVYKP